jgi:RimJ/RimL family protein N-acetyltransferase
MALGVNSLGRRPSNLGCPKINIQIRTGNTQVIEFYKRIGFKPDDVVSMGKRLESDQSAWK